MHIKEVTPHSGLAPRIRRQVLHERDIDLSHVHVDTKVLEPRKVCFEHCFCREVVQLGGDVRLKTDCEAIVRYTCVLVNVVDKFEDACSLESCEHGHQGRRENNSTLELFPPVEYTL
jgi:hypothetical protein